MILVTDGNVPRTQPVFTAPLFPFPCKLHVVPLCQPNTNQIRSALPFYQRLIDATGAGGVVVPEGSLTLKSVQRVSYLKFIIELQWFVPKIRIF